MRKEITKTYLKNLIYEVNGAAIEVHRNLGPGLLEEIYHKCMKHELTLRGINFVSEMKVPIIYKGVNIGADLKCDLFVEDILPVELKAVVTMHPIYDAQLLTYMNLLKVPEGLLINFNVINLFKNGQKTLVNNLYRNLPA